MRRIEEQLVVEIARALHQSGAPSPLVESAVESLIAEHGSEGQALVTPTSLSIAIDDRTQVARMAPPSLDLGRLTDAWETINAWVRSDLTAEEALLRLRTGQPRLAKHWLALCAAGIAAAAAPLLGGSWVDVVAAAIGGGLVWTVHGWAHGRGNTSPMADVVAGAVAAWIGGVAAAWGASPAIVVLAAVFVLLPGISMVAALSEIAAGSWNAGTMRTVGVLAVLARLGGGLSLGHALAPVAAAPVYGPLGTLAVLPASALVTLLSMMLMGAWRRDWAAAVVTAVVSAAISVYWEGTFGLFIAALWAGVAAWAWSMRTHVPAQSIVIAGILPLVPGAMGLGGAISLFAGQSQDVVEVAVKTIASATAVVGGLLAANVMGEAPVPRRDALPQENGKKVVFPTGGVVG